MIRFLRPVEASIQRETSRESQERGTKSVPEIGSLFFATEAHALRQFPRAVALSSCLLSSITTHSHQARAAEAAPQVRGHLRLKRRDIGRAALEARLVPSARSADQLRAEREATIAADEAEHKRKRTRATLSTGTLRVPLSSSSKRGRRAARRRLSFVDSTLRRSAAGTWRPSGGKASVILVRERAL